MTGATRNGTEEYLRYAIEHGVAPKHFSENQQLFLSGLGMGSYLGGLDDKTNKLVEEAVVKSVSSGAINVIDTAINYRQQLAELSIGNGLKQLLEGNFNRNQVFISSKNGYIPGDATNNLNGKEYKNEKLLDTGIVTEDDIVDGIHCMKPSFLRHQLKESLNNLGLEQIDLMYLHNAVQQQQQALGKDEFKNRLRDVFEFYEQARKEGKIQYYGMATWDCFRADLGDPIHFNLEDAVNIAKEIGGDQHGFKFVQLPVNMSMPEALTKENQQLGDRRVVFIEAAASLDIGIFASVPLMQGSILEYNLPEIKDRTPSQVALEFVRSIPEIIAPLVGHKTPEHVENNIELSKNSILKFEDYKTTYFREE